MKTVVKKEDLMDKIKSNRDKHHAIFVEAVEAYHKEALRRLEEKKQEILSGKVVNILIHIPVPEDHTHDYNRAIEMIEMDVREEIELGEEEFAQYVMDDWEWKRQWIGNTLSYTASQDNY